ncbi:tyrosine recombinase XerC [Orrella daihaiensis]|uniref:Tyrosine recombinase XerC n=1 Tax=Orrella daihaiensis TaxID=2782176 RepID=A0ABY4AJ78_9BURK|nr:tyrosine recombinase XerC [Orrella daihaiensis]UOD50338.1 tyrosine recombinase XerC [Orrella daihaiensis]
MNAPVNLPEPMRQWLDYLATQRRYAAHTISAYERDLRQLVELATDMAPQDIAERHIRQFLGKLHGQGHQPRSLARMLSAWRGFYAWWAPKIGLALNPVQDVKAPKANRSLPKAMSVDQTQALLENSALAASREPLTLRDRAIFELFYSSGLRLSELVSLDISYYKSSDYESSSWLEIAQQEVHVLGKGNKRRTVPVGQQATLALEAWLSVRDQFVKPQSDSCDQFALFLGERGKRIHPRVIQQRLAQLALAAGLPTRVHPHVLRHSFASHVLQSAQDLRAVQEMLGHASISTTQVYTKLDFQHLASVYDAAHPRANRKSSDKS